MRVNLKVPYRDKEEAKRAGARWDPARQVWYVENMADLSPLLKWMPSHLLKPHKSQEKTARPTKERWWSK